MYYILKLSEGDFMYRAYVFRLYPNKKQKELINQTIGCSRLVYNYYLAKKKKLYEEEKISLSCFDMIKDLNNMYLEYPFLKEVDSCSLRCSLFDLDNAYQKMFKEKSGYPKFKGKFTSKNAYRTNCMMSTYKGRVYESIKVDLINKTIKLPKLKDVKIRGYRNLEHISGKIINATITKDKTDKYYVSVLYEEKDIITKIVPKSIVGIDLGIKDIVITSNGEKIKNEHLIDKYEKRIKRKQRELSRRIKGSSNYYKTKKQIAILYKKLSNARKYLLHQITNKLVSENDIIVSESLKVKDLLEEKNLSKQLSNVCLSNLCNMLEYKCRLRGKRYIKINTYYPSSQTCSVCGHKNEKVKDLNVREWECIECGSSHDRDINASINILFEGLKIYMKELV